MCVVDVHQLWLWLRILVETEVRFLLFLGSILSLLFFLLSPFWFCDLGMNSTMLCIDLFHLLFVDHDFLSGFDDGLELVAGTSFHTPECSVGAATLLVSSLST